jgi:rod shape-determining protein MreC
VIRRRTFSLLIVICLGHVLLISAQVQSKSGLPVVEDVAFSAFARVQRLLAGTTDAGRSVWTNYFALRGAARESETLRARILELETRLQQQQAIADRARSLEATLKLRESVVAPTLAARVIAGNPSPGSFTVTIDRGTDDGVRPDMAVIGARGVVGRVVPPVTQHAATVQLLIDRLAGIAVTFERSGTGGMVIGGAGDPPFRAEYVNVLADVQAGERVMSSGQDGIYPQGFLVGTVERVDRRTGGEREIVIRPAVDYSYIDVVLIVLTPRDAKGGAE